MRILTTLALLLTFSCSNYVNRFHRQIDNDKRQTRAEAPQRQYARGADNRPVRNPVTLGGVPNTQSNRSYYPSSQRQYGEAKKRYKAEDLVDNGSDGSLWSGTKKENFLFVTNNLKNQGDIVIVEILSDFNQEIIKELARAYPDRPSKKKKDEDKKDDTKEEPKIAENNKTKDNKSESVDKISAQVLERLSNDYLLIRGNKEVVYKNGRRFVEIQGLISQKNITASDTIMSDKILEPKIRVLRN